MSSHESHSSHVSHSSKAGGNHSSTHSSHSSHSSAEAVTRSHTSHSSTGVHSNSYRPTTGHNSVAKVHTTTSKALSENIIKNTETSSVSKSIIPNASKMGDVNLDGIIDTNDVIAVLKDYASTSTGNKTLLNDIQIKNADINFDSKVDARDACEIKAYLTGDSSQK